MSDTALDQLASEASAQDGPAATGAGDRPGGDQAPGRPSQPTPGDHQVASAIVGVLEMVAVALRGPNWQMPAEIRRANVEAWAGLVHHYGVTPDHPAFAVALTTASWVSVAVSRDVQTMKQGSEHPAPAAPDHHEPPTADAGEGGEGTPAAPTGPGEW